MTLNELRETTKGQYPMGSAEILEQTETALLLKNLIHTMRWKLAVEWYGCQKSTKKSHL